mmetsp:Transcript_86145/g.224725  ORF Transcript_86145/g.224725 Transcript_86145/m.224725 type:complete len:429 (+) Transcript_86145:132-1418(+)
MSVQNPAMLRFSRRVGTRIAMARRRWTRRGRGGARSGVLRCLAVRGAISDQLEVAEEGEDALEDTDDDEDVAENPDEARLLVLEVLGGRRNLALHLRGEGALELLAVGPLAADPEEGQAWHDEHDGDTQGRALDQLDDGNVREGDAEVRARGEQPDRRPRNGGVAVQPQGLVDERSPGSAHALEGDGEDEDGGDVHAHPRELHGDAGGVVALQDVAQHIVPEPGKTHNAEHGEEDGGDAEAPQGALRVALERLLPELRVEGGCTVVGGERPVEQRDGLESVELDVPPVVDDSLHRGGLLRGRPALVEDVHAREPDGRQPHHGERLQRLEVAEQREGEDDEHDDGDGRPGAARGEDGARQQARHALGGEVPDEGDVADAAEERVKEEHHVDQLAGGRAHGHRHQRPVAAGARLGATVADEQEASRREHG